VSGPDPIALALRQRELDDARVRIPALVERKRARMLASPLAFLRGAAPLFYELLAAVPELAEGPEATGWIAGDLHVENFGAYRPSALTFSHDDDEDAQRAVFDINDFDDATVAPCRLDVLRLGTSLLLGTRDLGLPGPLRHELLVMLVDTHAEAIAGASRAPEPAPCVRALLTNVRTRTRKALLDARTEPTAHHGRRFARGPRYQDLTMELRREVPTAFERYLASLPEDERPSADAQPIQDAAFRVAGTGSLGCMRVAVLTRGKGGADGGFIFDLKEQGAPSAAALLAPPALGPVERVRTAAQSLNSHPPRMLGETTLLGMPCLGRRLSPQEDRLDWAHVKRDELPLLARHLGWITGRAHARALTAPLTQPWTASDRRALVERAIRLAGLHEAIYLAYAGQSPVTAPATP
jgi:uncharacterized protein (DUF2252 family)